MLLKITSTIRSFSFARLLALSSSFQMALMKAESFGMRTSPPHSCAVRWPPCRSAAARSSNRDSRTSSLIFGSRNRKKPLGVDAGASPTEALNPGLFDEVGAGLVGVFAAEFVAGLAGAELTASELAGGLVRATVVGLLGAGDSAGGASPALLLRAAVVGPFLRGRPRWSGRFTGSLVGLSGLSRRLRGSGLVGSGAGGGDLVRRFFVIRDEKLRDHAALLQIGAEPVRVIAIREYPRADAIKYAFSGTSLLTMYAEMFWALSCLTSSSASALFGEALICTVKVALCAPPARTIQEQAPTKRIIGV